MSDEAADAQPPAEATAAVVDAEAPASADTAADTAVEMEIPRGQSAEAALFEVLDADGDGHVDREEFAKAFNDIDTNQDGELSKGLFVPVLYAAALRLRPATVIGHRRDVCGVAARAQQRLELETVLLAVGWGGLGLRSPLHTLHMLARSPPFV